MPNWCTNNIIIQGSSEDVDFMLNAIKDEQDRSPISLNSIIKMPEALQGTAPQKDEEIAEENIKLYGHSDWYNWRVTNWGTKWDVQANIVYDRTMINLPGYRTVQISFDSAWSPPIEAINVMAKRFPNVKILHTFDERGVDFSGWRYYDSGEIADEVSLGTSFSSIAEVMSPDDVEAVFERFQ